MFHQMENFKNLLKNNNNKNNDFYCGKIKV